MKNIIDESSEFRKGNEIYYPKTDEYFKIVTSYHMKIYKDVMVFVVPLNMNLEEKVDSYRLSHLIRSGYYIIS